MKVFVNFILLFFILSMSSCYESEEGYQGVPYDPTQPVEILSFTPDSGGIRTQVVIEGKNFGTDTSKIKFFFGEKEAQLMSVKGEAAYVLVPKQPGEMSNIKVVIDDKSHVYEEKQFKYEIKASVSTLVGKAKQSGGQDGSIQEATFSNIRFVRLDKFGNIFVVEAVPRVRLVSMGSNKVITLSSGGSNKGLPCPSLDGEKMYIMNTKGGELTLFDPITQWVPEPQGQADSKNGVQNFYQGLAMAPQLPGNFLTRAYAGQIITGPLSKLNSSKVDTLHSGINSDGIAIGRSMDSQVLYNPHDEYLYVSLSNLSQIWRGKMNSDGTMDDLEFFAGTTVGFAEGQLADCKFNTPRGLDVDSDGNIFIADQFNHCIRKITPAGVVEVAAGQPGKAGYVDGDPTTEAQFNQPYAVTIDKNGYIYVSELGNHCIRKIAIE